MLGLFDILIQALTFGFVVVGVVLAQRSLLSAMAVRRRMGGPGQGQQQERNQGGILRSESVNNRFLIWIQSALLTDTGDRTKLRRDLAFAGFDHPAAPAIYVATRMSLAIGLPLFLILGLPLIGRPIQGLGAIVVPLLVCGVALIVPRSFVQRRAAARREALEFQFPDALDLLVVCVEAGLGLEAAVVRVADEVRESHPRIAHEFGQLATEMEAGRGRADALRAMAERVDVDSVKSFVALLIQTEALGVSIAQSLRTYSVEMRETRFLKAEEKAMRIPVLMTVPIVACFMPVIIVALLLPPLIDVVRTLMPTLAGR
jgi:tight adherence protein C